MRTDQQDSDSFPKRPWSLRSVVKRRSGERRRLHLQLEQLESRRLLAGDCATFATQSESATPIAGFELLAEGEAVAGILVSGEMESYVGEGTYQLDFFVEAVVAPITIAGFNAPLLIDTPGVSFAGNDSVFEPNAAFDLEFVTALGSPGAYGVAGSLGAGLQLEVGQRKVLFTIDLVVDSSFVQSTTDVASIITEGSFASALQFTDSDLASVQDVTIESAAQIVVPVPPTISLNSLAIDPADLPRGSQPTTWAQQRSRLNDIQIELDSAIGEVPADSITLTNLGMQDSDADQVISLRGEQISLDASGKIITIVLDANQLSEGRYQLDLSPAITGSQAYQFAGDDTNHFFVLRGDFDGNNSVDLRDLATLAYWIDDPDLAPGYVDVNDSGILNVLDLFVFRSNFGNALDVPGLPDAIDPGWIDLEALGRAEKSIETPQDVNGNGMVSPLDALQIINGLANEAFDVPAWRFDTNRDGQTSPRDALFVINTIALREQSPQGSLFGEDIVEDTPTVVLDLVGERQSYTGPGEYTFDFTVTSIGGDQTISGFNLPLAFDVPQVTFDGTQESFHRNPAFDYEFVAELSQPNRFGVAASSAGAGLMLTAGQPEVLFSIVVDVSATLDVESVLEIVSPIVAGADSQGLQFIGEGIDVIAPPSFVRGALLAPPGPVVQLTGATKEYTGEGTYTLDFIAEAIGGPISIAGFNAPLLVDVPGVTFAGVEDAFVPNAAFARKYVTALAPANTFGVAASIGSGLQIASGESAVLFTVELQVAPTAAIDAAADVAKIITSGVLANGLQLVDADAEPIPDVSVGAAAIIAQSIEPEVAINNGLSTRSQLTTLEVTFDAVVDHGALDSAFRLTNLNSDIVVGTINVSAADQDGKTIATLTFDGASTVTRLGVGILGNSLADGNYRLDIFGDQVYAENGQQLFRDEQFGDIPEDLLFRFLGDFDGDRDVDGQDYGRFGLSFLKSSGDPAFNPQFDSDGDGDVDGQDYGRFGLNFLKSI